MAINEMNFPCVGEYQFTQAKKLIIDGTTHVAFKVRKYNGLLNPDPDASCWEIFIVNAAEHPEALFCDAGFFPEHRYKQYRSWAINKSVDE